MVVCLHSSIIFLPRVELSFFFFISGFFVPKIAKYGFLDALWYRSKQLLLPTFGYSILFGLLAFLLARLPQSGFPHYRFFTWLTPEKIFFDPLFFQPLQPWAFTMWFLTALWWAGLLWLIFRRIIETWSAKSFFNRSLLIICLLFLYYSCINGPTLIANRYIGCFDRAIYAFVLLTFGFLLYPHKDFLFYGKGRLILLFLAAIAIAFKINYWNQLPSVSLRLMVFDIHFRPLYLFVTLSSIALFFVISIAISKLCFLERITSYIGEKSLHIMIFHPLGLWLYGYAMRIMDYHPWAVGRFLTGLFFSLICIFCYDRFTRKISKIINNIRLRKEDSCSKTKTI